MAYIAGIPLRDGIHTDSSTGISGWNTHRSALTEEFAAQAGNTSGRYGEFSKDIQEYNRKIDTLSGAWQDTGMFLTPYNAGFRYTGTGDFNKWDTYNLAFDGVDDYLRVGDAAALDFGVGQDFSIGLWFKTSNAAQSSEMLEKQAGGVFYQIRVPQNTDDQKTRFQIDDGTTQSAISSVNSGLADGNWHHLACVRDYGNTIYMYIDGAEDSSATDNTLGLDNTGDLILGGGSDGTSSVEASMDEVAIWNSALSAAQIRAIYNGGTPQSLAPYSPVAWWRMGDGLLDGNGMIGDQMNLTLGSELVLDDPYEAARWAASSTNTKTFVAGESVRFDRPASGGSPEGGYTYFTFHAIGCLKESLAANTTYEVTFTLESDDATIGADILGSDWAGHTYSTTGVGVKTMYLHTKDVVGSPYIMFYGLDNSKYVKLSNLSVKKVNGYAGGMINMTASDIVADTPLSNKWDVYSVLFDGVDEYVTTTADDTLASKSFSFWAKSDQTGPNGVFDHGSWQKGSFEFNDNSGRPRLDLGSSTLRYWTDNSAQDDNAWHHWVCYIEYDDITNCKLYCDGVLLGVNYTAENLYYAYSTGLRIGRGSFSYFDGSLDEFAVFDGELTLAQVVAIYNGGVPADLSSLSPDAWWRMGDGDYYDILKDSSGNDHDGTMTNMESSDIRADTP
jgi:hypothetical protein